MLWALLNPIAILITLVSFLFSFFFYRKVISKKEKYLLIGSMTQNVVLLVSFIMPIYYLRDLSDVDEFGHNLACTLVSIVLGLLINLITKVVSHILPED